MQYKQFSPICFLKELCLETCHFFLEIGKNWSLATANSSMILHLFYISHGSTILLPVAQIPLQIFVVSLKNKKAIKVKIDEKIALFSLVFSKLFSLRILW